jgi:uncharacterized repeat protein (TIGR01451 family)
MYTRNRICPPLLLFVFFLFGATIFAQTITVSMATTPACSLDGSATATLTGGTPPYTFYWYGPNVNLTNTSNVLSGVAGGMYYVYVYDNFNHSGYATFSIQSPFSATATTTADYCNSGTGTATANVSGGTGPFSYVWSNGNTTQTATGLYPGIYEVTITDNGTGCYISSPMDSSLYAYVGNNSPVQVTVSQTNSACTDGTATVTSATGGTAPYTYLWSTIPPQFTQTATGLAPGSYSVTVTDAAGCQGTGYAYVNQTANSLFGYTTSTPETCVQANGTATVSISGGTAPYTYIWSNGATTPVISGLSYGYYHVSVTDAMGCPKEKSVYVNRTDPMSLAFTSTNPNCSNTGGSVAVNVIGGTAPYTYQWGNGNTTNALTNVGIGYYGVYVSDANGCVDNGYHFLDMPASCYANVSGRVNGDMNADCIYNGTDFRMDNVIVEVGTAWTNTNSSGFYSFNLPPASNVNVSQVSMPNYFQVGCPVGGNHVISSVVALGNYPNLDFYNSPTTNANDLRIWVHASPARTTQPQVVTIGYSNVGSTILGGTIHFTHDALMSLLNGYSMSSYNLSTQTLTYNIPTLWPGQQGQVYCELTIPTSTPLSTAYTHNAEILPISGDVNPSDNTISYSSVVVGSYDPNQKSVAPNGELEPGVDSILTYTLEFQNTGNDTAFTVELRDSLDAALNPLSIEILGASHPYTWDIDYPGYLTFTFDHIMLPDSHINEAASHGWLMYRIQVKDNLPLGTQIHNTASIYFDYNAPVVTNTTLNTFGAVANTPSLQNTPDFILYPNPANDRVQLSFSDAWSGETQVTLHDLSGKLILTTTMNPQDGRTADLQVSALPKGVYLVECRTESTQQVKKLVLQ